MSVTGWIRQHRRRVAEIGFGHTAYALFNWQFDNVLYVYAVYRLGLLIGGALMTLLSLVQCAFLLVLYERMRIDWVGAGPLTAGHGSRGPAWWRRLLSWAADRGKFVVFLALCVFQDPFITTAYFRGGRFDGLKRRDWHLFFASVLVSNGYWTLRSGVVAALVSTLYNRVVG